MDSVTNGLSSTVQSSVPAAGNVPVAAAAGSNYPRLGGRYFQGECNVNDCVPFWIFSVMVCIQILSILAYAKTIDSATGMVRPARLSEKLKSVLKTLALDFLLALAIFYFCRECKNDWAWFVLFLPIILMGLLFFVFMANVSFLNKNVDQAQADPVASAITNGTQAIAGAISSGGGASK